MIQVGVWLALFAIGTSSARHQVDSFSVPNRSAPITSKDAHTQVTAPLVQPAMNTVGTTNVEKIKLLSIRAITTSVSRSGDNDASNSEYSTAGADAVRAGISSREWISTIFDTVVMALLALASIVVAIILGRKQLRAIKVQLELMLDIAHGHLRSDHVEMNDLERGQHDPDGNWIEVRSEISSVNSAQQAVLSTASGSLDFFPDTQPHVSSDDQLPQLVESHGSANGEVIFHSGIEQNGDEGHALEETRSCSRLDHLDSTPLDLGLEREWHLLTMAGISIH